MSELLQENGKVVTGESASRGVDKYGSGQVGEWTSRIVLG